MRYYTATSGAVKDNAGSLGTDAIRWDITPRPRSAGQSVSWT